MSASIGTSLDTGLAAGQGAQLQSVPAAPGWTPSPGRIAELRRRRRVRQIARKLYSGDWRTLLIAWGHTQHIFKKLENHRGHLNEFMVKLGFVRKCANLVANIVANEPPTFTISREFVEQRDAWNAIHERSLLDARIHSAVRTAFVEGSVPLLATVDEEGAVVCVESNDVTLPVGDPGPDGQPRVWERRWTTVREVAGRKQRYLHIERFRRDGGRWIKEREAYGTDTADTLVELEGLKRVPLGVAGVDPSAPDRRDLPVSRCPITQLVFGLDENEPAPVITEAMVDQIDALAAAMTRLCRVAEIHGDPKQRISEQMIDEKTGRVKRADAYVDPEKIVEYIQANYNFAALVDMLDKIIMWTCIDLDVAPALLSYKPSGGQQPDTEEKLELEATSTIAAAEAARPYQQDALGRHATVACEIESGTVGLGFAVDRVDAVMHIGLPKSMAQRNREAMTMADRGYHSRELVIRQIHGEERGEEIIEQIKRERAAEAERQRAASFGAFGLSPEASGPESDPDGEPERAEGDIEIETEEDAA